MPSADSPLIPLTKEPAWQRHARFFDNAFGQLEQRQLSKIRAWSESHLAAPKPTMFYMFSGPDFLYANAFYPKATTYVLSALEPTGQVPDLTRLPRGGVGAALYNVERSLGSILSFSFFITKQMKTDLSAGQISGTLPILYVFLARSGKTIRSVTPVALDDKGQAYYANENPGPNAVRGARIMFAGSDGVEKTLYYFSTDLSNSGAKSSGFLKFCLDARAGQQPDQERVVSAALRQFHHRARLHPRQQRHHHPGRFRRSADLLQQRSSGASSRSAATSARSANSPAGISNPMPSCSAAPSRSISASAIAGAPMNSNLLLSVKVEDGSAPVETTSSADPPPRRRRVPKKPKPPPPPQRGFLWFGR